MADVSLPQQTAGPFENMGRLQFKIVALCFFAILFDGIDTTAIGVVVPTLSRSWAVPPAAFTAAFLATNLGAVVGYIGCGPIADRIGRRPLIIVSVIWFGICTLLTVFVNSVTTLWILRFVTALGLGGAVPTGIAQAADYAPVKYRDAMTVAVTTGLTAGAMVSGLLGVALIQNFGWQSVFVVGGVLPLLLAPALWLWLPEAPNFRTVAAAPSPPKPLSGFARLFENQYAVRTVLLWGYAFLIFTTFYALVSWVPTLLLSFGFTPAQAPIGVAALGVGGVVGNIILAALAARIRRPVGADWHWYCRDRRHSWRRMGRFAARCAFDHANGSRCWSGRKLCRPGGACGFDLRKRTAHDRRGLLVSSRSCRFDCWSGNWRPDAGAKPAGARNRSVGLPTGSGRGRNFGAAEPLDEGGVNKYEMARPKRFELLTPKFVVWCSIQLSYGRVGRRS